MIADKIAIVIIIIVAVYTSSYGIWVWKYNKLASSVIWLLAVAVIAMPIYMMYWKRF